MPTLLLRFPGGRYHATPWGHHVNEGLIEWPPSPWRLLRALIACGYATQGWTEVPPAGRRLIESLAESLPVYRLPPASVAHSRHYMPLGVFDKGREKTTLVFDAWANVGDGSLAVRWSGDLDQEAQALFETLALNLGYLGRSESWVEGLAVGDDVELLAGEAAYPHVEGDRGGRGWEQVTVFAAEPAGVFRHWRDVTVGEALLSFPLPAGKTKPSAKLLKERKKVEEPFPTDLLDALQKDTAWWKAHRWSQPPGARRVLYWRRSDSLRVGEPVRRSRQTVPRVSAVLLALTASSNSRGALPTVDRALPQAERVHRALVRLVGDDERIDCPELTGREHNGSPLTGHRHAHILPVDLDGDGHLDHFIVHAPMGLGATAQDAIRAMRKTFMKGGVAELRLALAGHGELDDLRRLSPPWNLGVATVLGPSAGARTWTSVTPFVPPRFLKSRGTNSIAGQVQAELESRGMPSAAVEVLPWDDQTRRMRHFARVRRHPAKQPPLDVGFALRVTFDTAVAGPISLGYGAHFGLGLFGAGDHEATP